MRRLGRFLLAVVATLIVVSGAYGVWWYGLGQFDDDYCIVLEEAPDGEISYSAPEWEFPLTYRCDYGPGGEVTVNEPVPMVASAALGGVTVLAVAAIWWKLVTWSPRSEYEGKHGT